MTIASTLHALCSRPKVLTAVVVGSLLCIAVVAVLIVRRVLKTSLQTASLFNGVVNGNGEAVRVKAGKLPELSNGAEFGYSFWVFLQPSAPAVAERLVLAQPDAGGVTVTLDADANALSLRLPGASAVPKIKYVPMARWVHVVAVYANSAVTFFLDGEVHSVHAVDVPMSFAGPSSDIAISGGISAPDAAGFSGYVGYVSFMNFYPSVGLVKRMYALGPTTSAGGGVFSVFGMHGYGVRSPVYRLNTVEEAGDTSAL